MKRSYNPYRVKLHRSYKVEEVAALFDCHKQTVLRWLKLGLATTDGSRPYLIHGAELRVFLMQRGKRRKRPCKLDELYCLTCKCPRQPIDNRVEYISHNTVTGRLQGRCSVCGRSINKFAKRDGLDQFSKYLRVEYQGDVERIDDSGEPLLNVHLEEGDSNDSIQP